jgi:hypothetical protein
MISLLYGIILKLQTLVVDVSLFKGAGRLECITALVIAIFFEHGHILSHGLIDICSIAVQQQKTFGHVIIPRPFELRINHVVVIESKLLRIDNVMRSESHYYRMPKINFHGSVQDYDLNSPYLMF